MKSVINALNNGFRRLWHRTKRGLAVIVSCSVAGALAGGFYFGVVPILVIVNDVTNGVAPGSEVVIHAVVESMVLWGIVGGAVHGTLVLVADDHDLLLSTVAWSGLIGSIVTLAALGGLIANSTLIGAPGNLIWLMGSGSVTGAIASAVGVWVYARVYDD